MWQTQAADSLLPCGAAGQSVTSGPSLLTKPRCRIACGQRLQRLSACRRVDLLQHFRGAHHAEPTHRRRRAGQALQEPLRPLTCLQRRSFVEHPAQGRQRHVTELFEAFGGSLAHVKLGTPQVGQQRRKLPCVAAVLGREAPLQIGHGCFTRRNQRPDSPVGGGRIGAAQGSPQRVAFPNR